MLSPTPQTDSYSDRERPGERPSFLFDGPTNTSTQGLPVPLIYGRMRVGSIVVSADLSADDIALGSDYEPDDPVAT
jgi:predicted phage tail protein